MYRKINAGASVGHLGGGGMNVKCENVRCLVNVCGTHIIHVHCIHVCTFMYFTCAPHTY
jgi:hypothetical protein